MAVIHIPLFPDNKDKAKVQGEHVQQLINNGWIVSGSVYDKDTKVVTETILMTPDTTMFGFSTIKTPTSKAMPEIKNTFSIGEPVRIISTPDPLWNDEEGISINKALVGTTGKFFGLYTGDSKYKGYAIVRMDEYDYRLHFCNGLVSDGHGFFCTLESLQPISKGSQGSEKIEVGATVKFISNPNPATYGSSGKTFIGKEGVFKEDVGSDRCVVDVLNHYGSYDSISSLKSSIVSSAVFIPKHAVTLASGDIVRVIANDVSVNTSYVDKLAYVCGPLVLPGKAGMTIVDKVRIQVAVLGTAVSNPAAPGKKTEQKIIINVNCVEPVPVDQIFPGIKQGDIVTIVDVPDYSALGEAGKGWVGREATFLGFPEQEVCPDCGGIGAHTINDKCNAKTGLNYKYKYSAELEVENGKKLYAFPQTIAKGTAAKLGLFKLKDKVTITEMVPDVISSQAQFEKKFKGQVCSIEDIYYSPGHANHGKYNVYVPGVGNILVPKHLLAGVK